MSRVTTDQIAIMASDVEQLWQLLTECAASKPTIDLSGGSANAARDGYITQMHDLIALLDANRTLVFSGLREFAEWKKLAELYKQQLKGEIHEGYQSTLSNALAGTVKATAGEVGQSVGEVASAAKSGTTWGVAAAVLVLLIAWKLS